MTTKLNFTKMHGAGNDYIYVESLKKPVELAPELIQRLSDRHFGIGSDGVVQILSSDEADFRMRMFNVDGSEAEMCGNAVRCVAKYLFEKCLTKKTTIELETLAGIKILELRVQDSEVHSVRVDMGKPILDPARIPVSLDGERIVEYPFSIEDFHGCMTCVSMGNPHAVFFVDEITDELVHGLGPKIEISPCFPARINVEFVKVLSPTEVQMRVWERGSGETLCCGTGACAVAVAGVLNGITERKITLHATGGNLDLEWAENNHVFKTGPAEFVFEGSVGI